MEIRAKRYKKGLSKEVNVNVSEEELYHIYINDSNVFSIFALPRDLKELAIGFIVSEGIADYDKISEIDIIGNELWAKTKNKSGVKFATELRTSGCSGIIQTEPTPVDSGQKFDANIVLNSLKYLDKSSKEWKLTGGTHSASLISRKGKFLFGFEDIGRHNALDKVIGRALMKNQKFGNKFILFSGRLSSGIVLKTARLGIPLIVSNTAPFSRAVKLAERLNLALVGFARKKEFTVYSGFWRVVE